MTQLTLDVPEDVFAMLQQIQREAAFRSIEEVALMFLRNGCERVESMVAAREVFNLSSPVWPG